MTNIFLIPFLTLSLCFTTYHRTIYGEESIGEIPPFLSITEPENPTSDSQTICAITSEQPYDTLWWQLSSSSDFPLEATIENICSPIEYLTLSKDEQTFLSKDQTIYFFRAKGCINGFWGDWSEIFTFIVNDKASEKKESFNPNLYFYRSITVVDPPSKEYERNPFVDEVTWHTLSPYFIPRVFPVTAALDKIFQKNRVLHTRNSMIKAGFHLLSRPSDKVIVAKHPYLKGYLIKAYTDQMAASDLYWWKKRIDGARAIQEKIFQCGYQRMMKTPKKWIYPLPANPPPLHGDPYRKNFILVVEEMDILPKTHNLKAYKKKMTPTILNAFYIMLMDLKLIDSIYANNTPFCRDGRLAFVDTEHSLDTTRPVPITTVAKYLSSEMYSYWEQLILNGGPIRP